jgi:hypothetical protein
LTFQGYNVLLLKIKLVFMTEAAKEMIEVAIALYVSLIKKPEYGDRANGPLGGLASILFTK